jgi:hypothetical protein
LIELFYVILAFCAIALVALYAHYNFLKNLLEGYELKERQHNESKRNLQKMKLDETLGNLWCPEIDGLRAVCDCARCEYFKGIRKGLILCAWRERR